MTILNNNKYNQNSYRGKTINITYLLHPNYEETTINICSINITFINTKRDMSSIYSTSTILCLKYFSFSAWSIIVISRS